MMYELLEMDAEKRGEARGRAEGRSEGEARGRVEGEVKGAGLMARLATLLARDGKIEDIGTFWSAATLTWFFLA